MLQNQSVLFLNGRQEIGEEFQIYSAGQPLNSHQIPNIFNENYFLKKCMNVQAENLIFKYRDSTLWQAKVSYKSAW